MDFDYAILADGVAQRPDGKLDIFGAGFDTIFAAAVPARHHQMAFAIRLFLTRQEAESPHKVEVILLDADGAVIARVAGETSPPTQEQLDSIPAGRKIQIGAVLQFAGLVFPTYGAYHFAIHWDGTEARPPVVLYLQPLPAVAADNPPSAE
jgi:hypothetical protein